LWGGSGGNNVRGETKQGVEISVGKTKKERGGVEQLL